MRRTLTLLLLLTLLLSGCGQLAGQKQCTVTYFDLFDTVTTIVGCAGSEAAFQQQAQTIHDELLVYHRLFDIYNEYEGIANLKTVNAQAGKSAVKVEQAVIDLLLDCGAYCELTEGKVNAAMGSVLRLWHEARAESLDAPAKAHIPETAALRAAAEHCDFENVVIDEEASTVFLTDPETSLDVGAIAKGWACQRVAERAPSGMLISVGGNVVVTGPKDAEGTAWVIGIQHPKRSGDYLHTLCLTEGTVVTSGDYQRSYIVDGTAYHHIIDPETCMPSAYWSSVTVVCRDSALADALSTALFVLPLEEGRALAQRCGVEALWVDAEGTEYMTDGFAKLIRE